MTLEESVLRYERLRDVTARIARASAELDAARAEASLSPRHAVEVDDLGDRLRALHLQLANDVERAWNAAEAAARQARRGTLIGRLRDAVSAETTVPELRRDVP